MRAILGNPVYTGRAVWNRQRTDRVLVDPDNPGLGHREVVQWNNPDQWIISKEATHAALVSEAEFVAVQTVRAAQADARHVYLLTGLLRCGLCGRRMQGAVTRGNPAYRCRHGCTSGSSADPGRPKNFYVRESYVLARLPLLYARLSGGQSAGTTGSTRSATTKRKQTRPEEVIDYLRERALTLSYDHETRTLEVQHGEQPVRVTV